MPARDDKTPGALEGVTVIDLSSVVSGPLCCQILGDLGAEVCKIESPQGDITRMMGPPFKEGMSGLFAQVNRNKRGIVVDLKKDQGVALVRRLASSADVVVENFRPGVADRLGIGYEALAAANSGLIYAAITGFGPDGPYADQPAYDNVIQGLAGFAPVQGAGGPPQLIRSIVADKTSALTAAYAVLAALFARERNGGSGQRIDVPMLDAFASFMLPEAFGTETFLPKKEDQPGFDMGGVHRCWPTADGHVVMMVVEDHQFQGLCRVIEREDLIEDERCANLVTRIVHGEELLAIVAAELRKFTTAEILERARDHAVPVAPVHDLEGFLSDPQATANQAYFEAEDDTLGRVRMLAPPVRMRASPACFRRMPPRLGQHTGEVLQELGYEGAEIEGLRSRGVIA